MAGRTLVDIETDINKLKELNVLWKTDSGDKALIAALIEEKNKLGVTSRSREDIETELDEIKVQNKSWQTNVTDKKLVRCLTEEKNNLDEGRVSNVYHEAVTGNLATVKKLYTSSASPSTVSSVCIRENQLDDNYYSPCSNTFILFANKFSYENLPEFTKGPHERLVQVLEATKLDVDAAMTGNEDLGYCSQHHLKEEGVTALLSTNLQKCFNLYCQCLELVTAIQNKSYIMHQSIISNKYELDLALFYRFEKNDKFIRNGVKNLFPLLFMEFTKSETKSVSKKLPQAALYANYIFRMMNFETYFTWVPLLGIIISEKDMLIRLYAPTIVNNQWKIAEVDVLKCDVDQDSYRRLVHVMVQWTNFCINFLGAPSAKVTKSMNTNLAFDKNCNVIRFGDKFYKCYDYRKISGRNEVEEIYRRDPSFYKFGELRGLKTELDWEAKNSHQNRLQIISYDVVVGGHRPFFIFHFICLVKKVMNLHLNYIVHGDLRFSNVVFSNADDPEVNSTLIDFDLSGKAGERMYPLGFNTEIDDGFRHIGAAPKDLLQIEHDVEALRWMLNQYRPKNIHLRDTWESAVKEDLQSFVNAWDRESNFEKEEVEPVENTKMLVTKITGSPESKRDHYKN